MKLHRILPVLVLTLTLGLAPAYGASKEIIQLQTQVDQLQQQMTQMKPAFALARRGRPSIGAMLPKLSALLDAKASIARKSAATRKRKRDGGS